MHIFGDSIVKNVERHNKLLGDIEVLKKQQKVSSEAVLKSYATKKRDFINSVDSEVSKLQAQIASLKEHKVAQLELLDEERKVMLDKTINDYDRKITSTYNKAKKLEHLIQAEKANMEDVIKPSLVDNTPSDTNRAIVATSTETKVTKTTTKKTSK